MDECRIEISYIDPEAYTSVVDHDLRRGILKELYRSSLQGPISKQELAERLGIGYHQLFYQMHNHLARFWRVEREEKVRGTRKELVMASNQNAVHITLGSGNRLYMVDPLGDRFGPVAEVGIRCDSCSDEEVSSCLRIMDSSGFNLSIGEAETRLLESNNRTAPYRPLDFALVSALRGLVEGDSHPIIIPCRSCAFLRRFIGIEGIEE